MSRHSRPNVLVRAWHTLTHQHTYGVRFPGGEVVEDCYRRLTGRHVGTKVSQPGDRPNFQPIGGAR